MILKKSIKKSIKSNQNCYMDTKHQRKNWTATLMLNKNIRTKKRTNVCPNVCNNLIVKKFHIVINALWKTSSFHHHEYQLKLAVKFLKNLQKS